MDYIGEHIFIGQLGQFFIISAFVFSLLSFISYFISAHKSDTHWNALGIRIAMMKVGEAIKMLNDAGDK